MQASDQCFYCGRDENRCDEILFKNETVSVSVPLPKEAFICHPTIFNAIICERCYSKGMIPNGLDQYEIHYEFALSYGVILNSDCLDQTTRQAVESKCEKAFFAAVAIRQTADALAGLATHLSKSNPREAEKLFNRALQIKAGHFIATNNLANLNKRLK